MCTDKTFSFTNPKRLSLREIGLPRDVCRLKSWGFVRKGRLNGLMLRVCEICHGHTLLRSLDDPALRARVLARVVGEAYPEAPPSSLWLRVSDRLR